MTHSRTTSQTTPRTDWPPRPARDRRDAALLVAGLVAGSVLYGAVFSGDPVSPDADRVDRSSQVAQHGGAPTARR